MLYDILKICEMMCYNAQYERKRKDFIFRDCYNTDRRICRDWFCKLALIICWITSKKLMCEKCVKEQPQENQPTICV